MKTGTIDDQIDPELSGHEYKRQMAGLNWYDTEIGGSFDTCLASGPGVVLSGALFLPVAIVLTCILQVVVAGAPGNVGFVLMGIFLGSLAGCVIGVVVSLLMMTGMLLFVPCFNASLGCPLSARTQIGLTGSGAGFLSVAVVYVSFGIAGVVVSVLAMTMSMLFGHVAAIWYTRKPMAWAVRDRLKLRERLSRRPQFELKQLFVLTAWTAGFSFLLRISPHYIRVILLAFVAIQLLLTAADWVWIHMKGRIAA